MSVVTRTNLCTNPSFESVLTGWNAAGNPAPALALSTLQAHSRSRSLLVTWAAGNVFFPGAYYSVTGLTVGTTYTASAYVYVPAGGVAVNLLASGSGLLASSANTTATAQWVRLSVTFQATATSHNISVGPATTPVGGEQVFVDDVLIEQAPNAGTYFDGSSSGCQWTGTADQSTSQQLSGTLSITVTNEPNNNPPRRTIFITGAPGSTIQINRTDQDTATRPVRGGDPATVIGGSCVVYDYEAPFGDAATYTAVPSDGSANVFVAVPVLAVTQSWLIHPGIPSLSVPINGWRELSERSSDGGEAQHVVLGRQNPVIITDGTRKGESYQASIKTKTDTDLADLQALLSGATGMLLQVVYPFTGESIWEYVSVGTLGTARRTESFGDPSRRLTLNITVIDRPAGGVAALRTVADVTVEVGTVAQLAAKYKTVTGLLTGIAGT